MNANINIMETANGGYILRMYTHEGMAPQKEELWAVPPGEALSDHIAAFFASYALSDRVAKEQNKTAAGMATIVAQAQKHANSLLRNSVISPQPPQYVSTGIFGGSNLLGPSV